jgi:cytochrome c biogenesis protein ResB
MNEPLRRDGLALFQANWGPQDDPDAARLYSQLEVTRNPSDHWPTAAVIVIGVAMTLALALKFRQWLRQQAARAARAS